MAANIGKLDEHEVKTYSAQGAATFYLPVYSHSV